MRILKTVVISVLFISSLHAGKKRKRQTSDETLAQWADGLFLMYDEDFIDDVLPACTSDELDYLLEHNHVDPNCFGLLLQERPLHKLSSSFDPISDRIKKAQILINHGADINIRDEYGWTPLDAAVHKNNGVMVKFLLAQGAQINKASLYYSIRFNQLGVTNELIRYGSNPYVKYSLMAIVDAAPIDSPDPQAVQKMVNLRTAEIWMMFRKRLPQLVIEEIIKHYFDVPAHPETEIPLLKYVWNKNKQLNERNQRRQEEIAKRNPRYNTRSITKITRIGLSK